MRFRFTRKRFLVLVILGVLFPTALLTYFSIQLQRQMFHTQSQILEQYTSFSVDYAISQMQTDIREREREVYMHFRMVGMLQRFNPDRELARIESIYPFVSHTFLRDIDGNLHMSDDDFSLRGSIVQQAGLLHSSYRLGLGTSLDIDKDAAVLIIEEVLDPKTITHLLKTPDAHFFRGGPESGGPFHMVAFGLFDGKGNPYGIAGFLLNLDRVRRTFLPDVLEEAIEQAEVRFSTHFTDNLAFYLQDHKGKIVYVHQHNGNRSQNPPDHYLAQAELWDVLPGWHLGVDYLGDDIRRHLFLSNTALVVVMAAMAIAGMLLSLKFILREMEFSNTKAHFVSNITHELKTPLAAIRLYAETLQQKRVKDDAQANEFLAIINKESVRLTHLINNILDFAGIDVDRQRYRFREAAVGAIVREVVDAYRYQMRDKGAEMHLTVEEDLPPLQVDHDALSQAVLNLLDNAVKYSPQEKRIDIQVARAGLPKRPRDFGRRVFGEHVTDGIRISIRDHGMGIPAGEFEKLFGAFYRVEKGLEHSIKGSGLGLAVVRHVVEAHRGALYILSRPGVGSTFSICLPL